MSEIAKAKCDLADLERRQKLTDRIFGTLIGAMSVFVAVILPLLAK